jgi:hypothetical protein
MWDISPVAKAVTHLRTTGNAFWMRVLEWLGLGDEAQQAYALSGPSFDLPVTITVDFDPSWNPHLDYSQAVIHQWDDSSQVWVGLSTSIASQSHQASAETLYPGNFDLQAPLICPADTLEVNDTYDGAAMIQTDGTIVGSLFDIAQDEDWFRFEANSGVKYKIHTQNLAPDTDTFVELIDTDGLTSLLLDDNSGEGLASSLEWVSSSDGYYFILVSSTPSGITGCDAIYEISVQFELPTFADVPFSHSFYDYIQALWDGDYTAGCSTDPLMYCPDQIMNRAMSAVFMLRGHLGVEYAPPPEPWDTFADDWSLSDIAWAEKWAEGMWEEELTAGCLADPLMYCPRRELPRVEAAVFGLRMKHGVDYVPPPGTGTLFADMTDPDYWGTKWAEQAYLDGLLPECGMQGDQPLFCPDDLVDRAWGAYLIVQAKDLLPP